MKIFSKIIYIVLVFVGVCVVAASAMEPWLDNNVNKKTVLAFIFIYIVFLVLIMAICFKLSPKVLNRMVIVGFIFMAILLLTIVFNMKLIPKVDLSHIYKQCMEMLDNSSEKFSDVKYFGFYTNNIPITIVIYWVFRMAKAVGCTDYRLAGGLFNVCMILVTMVSSYKILKQLTNYRLASFIMIVLFTNPVFYAYVAYYYTDTISIPFLVIGCYCIIRGMKADNCYRECIYYIFSGILITFGMKIRVTTLFIALAAIAAFIIQKKWKALLKYLISFLLGFVCINMVWFQIYNYHIPFETKDSKVTMEHFLMMASKGNGTFDAQDVAYTKSFKTHEDKVKNNRKLWKQRVIENGLLGNLRLVAKKESIVWGVGTRGFLQYTQYVKEKSLCYELIAGKYSVVFKSYMQAYNIVLFLMITFGIIAGRKNRSLFIFEIYWGGAILFYAFWEAHPRHAISFLVLITFLIIPFIENISGKYMSYKRKHMM